MASIKLLFTDLQNLVLWSMLKVSCGGYLELMTQKMHLLQRVIKDTFYFWSQFRGRITSKYLSYVKTLSCCGGHLDFQMTLKNQHYVEGQHGQQMKISAINFFKDEKKNNGPEKKTKDWATQKPLNNRGELRYSARVRSSCYTSSNIMGDNSSF